MNPLLHLAYTYLIAEIFSQAFTPNPLFSQFVLVALLGTIIIDAIDHSLILLFIDCQLVRETRYLIKEKKFLKALKHYYLNRKGGIPKAPIHNLFAVIVFIVLSIIVFYFYGFASIVFSLVFFGFTLHLLEDLFEDVVLGKNREFWTLKEYIK